jgi:HSP20 family protein
MYNTNRKGNALLTILALLLVVVVAIQAFFLFQTHNRLKEFLGKKPVIPESSTAKAISPSSPNNNALLFNNEWPNMPFDPDKWNPFDEMEQMQRSMNHMFDTAFGRFGMSPHFHNLPEEKAFSPKLDLKDEEDRYVIQIDLPGVEKTDIDVQVEDQVLTVKGKREETIERSDKSGKATFHERRMGEFERVIGLPEAVDSKHMETSYEKGILTVIIPKGNS